MPAVEFEFVELLKTEVPEESLGTPGGTAPSPQCRCLFCKKQFSARLARIRAHVGGVKGQDVQLCKGPTKTPEMTDEEFETLTAQFKEAQLRCYESFEAAKKNKRTNSGIKKRKGDELSSAMVCTENPEPSTGIQESADEALNRAFAECGIPPSALDNEHMQKALRLVAAVGGDYSPPIPPKMWELYKDSMVQVLVPEKPHTDAVDGGHLIVKPFPAQNSPAPRDISECSRETRHRVIDACAACSAAILSLSGMEGGMTNIQDNGNWVMRNNTSGFSPKAVHYHVYGRAPGALKQPFGEALSFPPFSERHSLQCQPYDAVQRQALKEFIQEYMSHIS